MAVRSGLDEDGMLMVCPCLEIALTRRVPGSSWNLSILAYQ